MTAMNMLCRQLANPKVEPAFTSASAWDVFDASVTVVEELVASVSFVVGLLVSLLVELVARLKVEFLKSFEALLATSN